MKENPNYRDEYAEILKAFNNRHFLDINEVCEYTGHCYRWVKKWLGIEKPGCSAMTLAKAMSKF